MVSRTEDGIMDHKRGYHEPASVPRVRKGAVAALAALAVIAMLTGIALAQTQGSTARNREREEIRSAAQEPAGDALRDRIRDRIEKEEGLQDNEREQLRQNLAECKQLGLNDETVAALFDGSEPLQKQLRNQERVLAMAKEGLPYEPVMQKFQEGRRKGVNDEALDGACARMEEQVRAANRIMERARERGVTPGDADAERRRTGEMAMQMWRGLNEQDGDQLCERARLRLRDGSCTTEDLTAAAETAAKLKEMGIEHRRAVEFAGEALQQGYSAREMRQLSWMVMTAHVHGGPRNEVLDTLERGMRGQREFASMMQEMWQHGWMGPADEQGRHGHGGGIDDATGGGPGGSDHKGHEGGMGGSQQGGGQQGGGSGTQQGGGSQQGGGQQGGSGGGK